MKKLLLPAAFIVISLNLIIAQVPQAMNYQAILRNPQGNILDTATFCARFTILDSINPGNPVYQEIHSNLQTNQFGLFTTQIGFGTVTFGTFNTIPWATGEKYLVVEIDITCSGNYVTMGASELLSVPYALYAQSSGSSTSAWGLTGNAGTSTAINFIGTTDTAGLAFRVDNQRAGLIDIDSNASFGIGALNSNTGGGENSALGYGALFANTSGHYNAALGSQPLYNNTSGSYNIGIGQQALYSNATGSNNIALGFWALYSSNSTDDNIAIGPQALYMDTSGTYNTAIGGLALVSNLNGSFNVAVGSQAVGYNLDGNGNTGVGYQALVGSTSGSSNTALGVGADVTLPYLSNATAIGAYAQVSESNAMVLGNGVTVGIGTRFPDTTTLLDVEGKVKIADGTQAAGKVLTSNANGVASWVSDSALTAANGWGLKGNRGTAYGANFIGTADTQNLMFKVNGLLAGRLEADTTESPWLLNGNTSLGYRALQSNTPGNGGGFNGYGNAAVGSQAMLANTMGYYNVAIGGQALKYNQTGYYNTAIGFGTMPTNISGTDNTVIGYGADVGADGLSNATAIGANAIAGASNTLVLGSGANVGIGTSTPAVLLDVEGGTTSPAFKLVDGTQAAGNVLVSDANGNASWQPVPGTHKIGDSYGGGIVFWVDSTGQHGLIAATADQNGFTNWLNESTLTNTTTNAVRDGIFAGKANTDFIMISEGAGTSAAQVAAAYQGSNYGDWYLPSKYELNLLYIERTVIGGFQNNIYWSSTEADTNDAWFENFTSGFQGSTIKNSNEYVRPVRAF